MRIISKKPLMEFWEKEPEAEQALKAWLAEAKDSQWRTPADVQAKHRSASILKDGRVVFNIHGNAYRLVVWINYEFFTIYVRFIGTHSEYDTIDAEKI